MAAYHDDHLMAQLEDYAKQHRYEDLRYMDFTQLNSNDASS